ncbi:MAG: 4Fe-4S binding protein [Thermoguttaceae bacterium]|jgi:polyferredoxin
MVAMAKNHPVANVARIARWRAWVQAAFLLVWLDPLMLRMHGLCLPVFHCYSCPLATFACPIGVLANFSALHAMPYIALGTLLLWGGLLGTFVCGWICPFGFFQDLLGRIPTPKFALPEWLGLFRYVVLACLVLAVPYLYGDRHWLFFCSLCPAGALEAALPHGVCPSALKLAITLLVLAFALFTWRPWCAVFCPLGAIYGLLNRVSLFFVRYHPLACNDCDLCHGRCRYRGRSQKRLSETRCVRCLECIHCRALTAGTLLGNTIQLENVRQACESVDPKSPHPGPLPPVASDGMGEGDL